VGEQVLDAREARLPGRREAVKERHLVEEHRQVGGESRHGVSSSLGWLGRPGAYSAATGCGGRSRVSSNSTILSISVPMAMFVTLSRMNSTTTGTRCSCMSRRASAKAD